MTEFTDMDRTQACASRTEALITALDKLVRAAAAYRTMSGLGSPAPLDSALLQARLVLSLIAALDEGEAK